MDIITWVKSMNFLKRATDLSGELKKLREFGVSIAMPHLLELDTELAPIFDAATREGVEIHPWIKPGFAVRDPIKRQLSATALSRQRNRFGTAILRDCLNARRNREEGLNNLAALIRLYKGKIKGIHLDYVRNDNALFLRDYPCACEACQEEREKWLGHGVLTRKDMKNPAVIYKELDTRNKNIIDYVRKARALTKEQNIRLSLAARANYVNQPDIEDAPVYGLGPAVCEGQDWHAWAEEGLFDFICAMNYHTDLKIFRKVATEHARLLKNAPVAFYCGIGVESSMGKAGPELARKLIAAAGKIGADGVSLFHYEAINDASYKEALLKAKSI